MHLVQGDTPLLLKNMPKKQRNEKVNERDKKRDRSSKDREPRKRKDTGIAMEIFRIEVGRSHGVKPGNIVGAIANEAGIDGDHIASIKIEENYSTVELPAGMPKELFQSLKKIRVVGQALKISHYNEEAKKKAKSKKRMGPKTSRRSKDSEDK